MPNITMLDLDELKNTKLRPYIEKSLELRAPDPGFHAMMGHNIDLAEVGLSGVDGRVQFRRTLIIR